MNYNEKIELSIIATRGRLLGLDAIHSCNSGHIGGAYSSIDIITYLYFREMKIDAQNPTWKERDRFVLSKGHCTAALYPVLAMRGYFPEKDLLTFRNIDSYLSGHAEMRHVPGVDMSTGSLAQGFSAAVGMALGAKLDRSESRVYTVLGDGEIQEGQVWEAAMAAAKYKLDNLVAFVDVNGLQIDGTTDEIMPMNPLTDKWQAFGWNVLEIDGHDFDEIEAALQKSREVKGKPTVVLAKTIKGRGISFMENNVAWHGHAPNNEEYYRARQELLAALAQLEEMV